MPTGKTKDQGWEIGVRRTFAITPQRAWELLMTQPGLGYWLGRGVTAFKKGDTFETDEKTSGEIRSYSEGSLIRLRWQPNGSTTESTLQVRVMPAKKGAIISIHHERLENADEREAMQKHWSGVLDKLGAIIESK